MVLKLFTKIKLIMRTLSRGRMPTTQDPTILPRSVRTGWQKSPCKQYRALSLGYDEKIKLAATLLDRILGIVHTRQHFLWHHWEWPMWNTVGKLTKCSCKGTDNSMTYMRALVFHMININVISPTISTNAKPVTKYYLLCHQSGLYRVKV